MSEEADHPARSGGFFRPNIDGRGRVARAVGALGLVGAALGARAASPWLAAACLLGAAVVLYEAARGWCVVRACGFRTPL